MDQFASYEGAYGLKMMAADDKDKHCELFVEITQLVVMPVMTI
jgi:hypothetical protein